MVQMYVQRRRKLKEKKEERNVQNILDNLNASATERDQKEVPRREDITTIPIMAISRKNNAKQIRRQQASTVTVNCSAAS